MMNRYIFLALAILSMFTASCREDEEDMQIIDAETTTIQTVPPLRWLNWIAC